VTRRTNARLAGIAFLLYIAFGITSMVAFGRATGGEGVAAKLASIAQHVTDVRITLLLTLLCSFCACALGVSLWAITRDQDPDLAMMGLVFRVGEGVIGGIAVHRSLSLLWLATVTGTYAPRPDEAQALGAFLLRGQGGDVSASFFAVGSTCFSWLLLRGRMIPAWLAWLGFISSVMWVVGFPLQMVDALPSQFTYALYIPMAVFEVVLALLLIFKGAEVRAVRAPA
jgi:hypothetical protein